MRVNRESSSCHSPCAQRAALHLLGNEKQALKIARKRRSDTGKVVSISRRHCGLAVRVNRHDHMSVLLRSAQQYGMKANSLLKQLQIWLTQAQLQDCGV